MHYRRIGFVSGGGGRWYSRTLEALQPGHRIFVHIPGEGYVGVGEVEAPSVPVRDFVVQMDGQRIPILDAGVPAPRMGETADDPERSEYLVRVKWLKTVPRQQAAWERGMFANQNTACPLRSSFTRDRVLNGLGLDR